MSAQEPRLARTALTEQAGTANSSQSYYGTDGLSSWITATAAIPSQMARRLPPAPALLPVPIPPPILPSSLVSLYGGDSYSIGDHKYPRSRGSSHSPRYLEIPQQYFGSGVTSMNDNDQFNCPGAVSGPQAEF